MTLPVFNVAGLLPPGIHDANLTEVTERFGGSLTRRQLLQGLGQYLSELNRWKLAQAVLIDGSFVTDEPEPNDIDVVLVLSDGYDLSQCVSPFEYNLRSRRRVQRAYGLDLFVVMPESLEFERFVDCFSQVRNKPQQTKGLVRVQP